MQVVIEIDDYLYRQIFSDAEIMIYTGRSGGKTLLATLLRSIRIGTPLPKGHGRLIDADELIKDRVSNDNVVILANTAKTIVPAEKREDDADSD